MKKFNLLYAAVFVFAPLAINAQVNQTPIHTGGSQIMTKRETSQAATGSMFINERYMPAKLTNEEKTVLARYNAYSDYFEISDPQNQTVTTLTASPDTQITFVANNETYAYVSYETEKGEKKTGYLIVISDNPNVKIYKNEKIYLQPESFPNNSYQTYKPANYKRADDEFYVKIKDGDIKYFSNKKELAKLIPGKDKEVLSYIKKNKLDVEKTADLVELANYVQSIL